MTPERALALLAIALAAYRVARLIAADTISEPMRAALFPWAWRETGRKAADGSPALTPAGGAWRTWLYSLVSCPLCVGVWASAGLYLTWFHARDVRPVIAVLAIAGMQCHLQARSP